MAAPQSNPTNVTSTPLITDDFYGYLPSRVAALFGTVYFGAATVVCLLQIIFGCYQHRWLLLLAVASAGEALGWGARLWAHASVSRQTY
jgi:hypothetical protein